MTSFSARPTQANAVLFEIWHREGGWTDYLHDYADGSEETGRSLSHEADAENEHRRKIAAEAGIDPEKVPLVACHKRYEHEVDSIVRNTRRPS